MGTDKKSVVIICPVHNEEQNIHPFFDRLLKAISGVEDMGYKFYLLFMNNRSTDSSLSNIHEIEGRHDWVYHITLSRNFGYQLSLLCGLGVSEADYYMICDVDCEDPPEMLAEFLREIRNGNDIAYGIRTNRPDTYLMSVCRRIFYRLLSRVGDFTVIPYMAEFSLFKRVVRDAVITNRSTFPFLRTEIGYAGFNIKGVPYKRETRKFGVSHYSYFRSFQFAWSGFLASTTFPLRAAIYLLPLLWLLNLMFALSFLWGFSGLGETVVGLIFLNGVFVSTILSFISIYLARVYHNVLGRERVIIDFERSTIPAGAIRGAPRGNRGEITWNVFG